MVFKARLFIYAAALISIFMIRILKYSAEIVPRFRNKSAQKNLL